MSLGHWLKLCCGEFILFGVHWDELDWSVFVKTFFFFFHWNVILPRRKMDLAAFTDLFFMNLIFFVMWNPRGGGGGIGKIPIT